MKLRDFQSEVKNKIYEAWAEPNVFNVMPVMPTGSGKTVTFCSVVIDYAQPACAMVHRQEILGQMSLAFNREKIPHAIIAPRKIQQQIIALHHDTDGYSCYSHRSEVRVASVDTLLGHDTKDRWLNQVALTVIDEGHHVQAENKWARALALTPRARGLFPTAHALRADGGGLGRGKGGLVDRLVIGPCARDLITRGLLTDYAIYCPPSDLDFSALAVGASGELPMHAVRSITHKSSKIVGDVVGSYLKHAYGKLGVTFAVDVEHATEISRAYEHKGVPAAVISSKTPIGVRSKLMRMFRTRQLLQLVSVDCLGEGVDVPAIEVISMARKTASFQVYAQQVGRLLRVMVGEHHAARWGDYTDAQRLALIAASDKPFGTLIDHVGNFMYFVSMGYGPPDIEQAYTLDPRDIRSRGKNDAIPLRACEKCTKPYARFRLVCPYCGAVPTVTDRSSPEQVDGDPELLDPAVLSALRGEINRIDGLQLGPRYIQTAHLERQKAQANLRRAMSVWGGWQESAMATREAQRLFFHTFGVDYMTAQTLGRPGAETLELKIREALQRSNITEATR